MKSPLITVITVSYNAALSIEQTILSVINQTCLNIEYIIIDGGSTDSTVDVIKKYADKISYWVSEPDKGIYDAMNKGIKAAIGKYTLFMNVNDTFYDCSTVAEVCNLIEKYDSQHDAYYGNVAISNEYGLYIMKPGSLELIKRKMIFSHQSVFIRTSLLKKYLFDLRYRFAADYNQLSLLYLSGHSFCYVDVTIALTPVDSGATYENYVSSTKEHFLILKGRGEHIFWAEKKTFFLRWLVRSVKSIVPKSLLYPLLRRVAKYKII